MSLRFRLLLSFTSVVIVSVILFVLSSYLLSVAVTGDVRSLNNFYKIHYSLHPLSEEEESLFLDLKYLAKNDPEQLKNMQLLEKYNTDLKMEKAALVVRVNDSILYAAPSLSSVDFPFILPEYDMRNNVIRNTLNAGSRFFSYSKFDFYFSSETKEKGSIFVIHERSPFAQVIRRMLPILIGLFAVILLLTGFLLYRYVTRKIIKPLDQLRRSAEHIKDGDLTFELKAASKDEVGQLVQTFDQMRQRLYESIQLQLHYEENRKQLISNISHDLRTPITTIKGYAEGIRDGVTNTEEKLNKYVSAIHTRASDMERLVNELLYFSKLDLKKEPFSFQKLELSAFLYNTADDMSIEFHNQHVDVTWENMPEQPLFVLADREKLKRVLINLFDNCLKYMNQPPKCITIAVNHDEDDVVIAITDNGPGIPEEAIPHIFERFYRVEPSRNQTVAGGSGLGLAIAQQIIEGHGGKIRASSELGRGTSISFTLKRVR
ncbi:two-component sensor histidine kinase [Paenibacillus glycanilyticus]|uniref:histidine kinase n=1 Tax=Paenibacillus glycanilyticus TaxID=126569 RepID=A0ABQ6NPF7_9BACL|nr:HAMP domain-containing sensor histidine kinase [Paenibacillus glycanilyticus]GMK46961.1 two-component sensor histidine kinase [Paenibacillus glycanilyticus]